MATEDRVQASAEPDAEHSQADEEDDDDDADGCGADVDASDDAADTTGADGTAESRKRKAKAQRKQDRREKMASRWKQERKRRRTTRKRRPLGGPADVDGEEGASGAEGAEAAECAEGDDGAGDDPGCTSHNQQPCSSRIASPPPPPDWAAGMDQEEKRKHRALRKEAEINDFKARCALGATLVLDLEWEADLYDRELKALVQQVLYSYGSNRSAVRPARLVLSGVRPESDILKRLQKLAGFPDAWAGVEILAVPYIERFGSEADKRRLVYLTADTDNVIKDFEQDKVYIIGGIVDHNRLKGCTLAKAEEQGIATARLPLQEHIQMGASRKVLTVNHVLDIVLEHQRCGNWRATFEKCVPGRKQFIDEVDVSAGGTNGTEECRPAPADRSKAEVADPADGVTADSSASHLTIRAEHVELAGGHNPVAHTG